MEIPFFCLKWLSLRVPVAGSGAWGGSEMLPGRFDVEWKVDFLTAVALIGIPSNLGSISWISMMGTPLLGSGDEMERKSVVTDFRGTIRGLMGI